MSSADMEKEKYSLYSSSMGSSFILRSEQSDRVSCITEKSVQIIVITYFLTFTH